MTAPTGTADSSRERSSGQVDSSRKRSSGASDDTKSERRLAFWLISPAVLLMLAVTAYPIAYAVWLSLQRYNLAAPDDTKGGECE